MHVQLVSPLEVTVTLSDRGNGKMSICCEALSFTDVVDAGTVPAVLTWLTSLCNVTATSPHTAVPLDNYVQHWLQHHAVDVPAMDNVVRHRTFREYAPNSDFVLAEVTFTMYEVTLPDGTVYQHRQKLAVWQHYLLKLAEAHGYTRQFNYECKLLQRIAREQNAQ